jgi:hypothetical protein
MMGKACQIAGMPKRLNQHLWRKMFATRAIDLGISDMPWKTLLFRKVPFSERTYWLTEDRLRPHWEKIVNTMPLESKPNGGFGAVEQELGELKEALTSIEKENMTLKTRVNNLQSNTMKLEDRLDNYSELLANWVEMGDFTQEEKNAIRMKWKIREWTEEEREQMRAFVDFATELKNEKGKVNDEEFRRRLKAAPRKEGGE